MNTRVTTAPASATGAAARDARYGRLMHMVATDRCVILDGANGTELIDVSGERPEVEEHLWGLTAIVDAPAHVKAVLIGPSLLLPVGDGAIALGTAQGIYLCEHRDRGGERRLIATLNGGR